MRILVIGLGSMGKRRVRNLHALDAPNVAGFDVRDDRRTEAHAKYGIQVFEDFETAVKTHRPDVFVISTPPDLHMKYAFYALEKGIHCFIEASVIEVEKIRTLATQARESGVVMAPSCTMRYFPGPRKVKELVQSNAIGRVLNLNYQTGQYLPDWHPWEPIESYYVSKRQTGAGREIVPFELTWLNDIFGTPTPLACVKAKLTDMPADIDDIYHCLLRYDGGTLANVTVEVISRPAATRELRVLGSEGEIVYSADANVVRFINTTQSKWAEFDLGKGTVEAQYINPEEPYIFEMRDFLSAVKAKDNSKFPNSLEDDAAVLDTLYALEKLSEARA